jgi:MinD-like ATPase involved in chromosome partitioning or flagellar assembly
VATGERVGVLLAAGPAGWEPAAVRGLGAAGRRVVLVRRCLDINDLLAAAATGTADVAVVSDRLVGLDGDSVARLAASGVRTLAVTGAPGRDAAGEELVAARARLLRLGVARVVDEGSVDALADHVIAAALQQPGSTPQRAVLDEPEVPAFPEERTDAVGGRLVAVWGPHGAPGRTTVAVGLAAEAASRGTSTLLLDADPYGGAVAQHLAVLDEVSGLLAAVRLANGGELDVRSLAAAARGVAPRLRILSGLPRPQRWREVRPQPFDELLDVARELDPLVVVDAGPGLPDDLVDAFPGSHRRDDVSVAALTAADEVVAVGSADPVGLAALARALPELVELRGEEGLRVVVNRMRPSLGWSEEQVRALVRGVAPRAPVTLLPDDRAGADRALVSGRTLVDSGDGALRRAVAALADEVVPGPATAGGRRWGRRRRLQTVSSR